MKKNFFLITMYLLAAPIAIIAQPVSQTFNASGTYTVPVGYSAVVTIEAWGGGGSAGGGGTGNGDRSGGGGGAYAKITGQTLAAGTYAITVGIGGIAPAASGVGQNGLSSSFAALVIAAGGSAGSNTNNGTAPLGGAGGTAAASTGTTKFSGGGGGGRANSNAGGGGGGSATTIANGTNGNNGVTNTGGTGGAGTGAGGAGGNAGLVGNNGIAPGGGGGGKANGAATSGNGAAGRVVVTVTGVLAIQFNYFNAAKGNDYNTLNWLASCGSSQATFEVQRSTDGNNFTTINTIVASQLRCSQPFNYVDNSSNLYSTVYYRIKSTEFTGSVTYSSIIKLSSQQKNMQLLAVLPNPATNMAKLSIASIQNNIIRLAIISMDGKVVQQSNVPLQAGISIINVDVAHLASGTYFIKGIFSSGQTDVIKFIKQ